MQGSDVYLQKVPNFLCVKKKVQYFCIKPLHFLWWNRRRFALAIFFSLLLTSKLDALCGSNVNPIRVLTTRAGSTPMSGSSKRKKRALLCPLFPFWWNRRCLPSAIYPHSAPGKQAWRSSNGVCEPDSVQSTEQVQLLRRFH